MPLFEIVLSFRDREEVRLTDRPLAVGDILELDHRHWRVVDARPPIGGRAEASYVCEPAPLRTESGQIRERLDDEIAARARTLTGWPEDGSTPSAVAASG